MKKKRLIITFSIAIPIILIISFVSAFLIKLNNSPEHQLKLSGKNIIHTIKFEEQRIGHFLNEIFITESDNKICFDVYEREVKSKINSIMGAYGTEYGKLRKIEFNGCDMFADYDQLNEECAIYVHDPNERENLNFKQYASYYTVYYVQKAPLGAGNGSYEFDNLIVATQIIDYNNVKYQLLTLRRKNNIEVNNLNITDIENIIYKINK